MSKRNFKSSKPTKGYKSKTQIIAHNEARKVVKATLSKEIETKMYDGQIASVGISYSGALLPLYYDTNGISAIARGTSNNEYIGDTVKPVGVRLRYNIIGSDGTNMFRVIVFQARGDAANLVAADILQSVGNVRTPLSDYDKDFLHEFRVLYDKLHFLYTLDNNLTPMMQGATVYIPGKRLSKTRFSDGAGTVGVGNIYIALFSDSAAVAHPTIQVFHRILYKDA